MPTFAPLIDYYLERLRRGHGDQAYHGLLETSYEILPELIVAFRAEMDTRIREFLLGIIWERWQESVRPFVGDALLDIKASREPAVTLARSVIALLGEALLDPEPLVWKQALDGLVAFASPEALEALRAARTRQFPSQRDTEEFRRWLQEATEQAEDRHREHESEDAPPAQPRVE